MSDMSGFDLRKYQEDEDEKQKLKNVLGKFVSGREGYEFLEEEKPKKINRCPNCNWVLEGAEKFCPECGTNCKKELECGESNKNCEIVEKCD